MAQGSRLTDRMLAAARGPVVIKDPTHRGLELRITANGVKTWSRRYRAGVDEHGKQKQRRVTIGNFQSMGLAAARARFDEIDRAISAGGDPQARKEVARTAVTVGAFAKRYLDEYASPKKRSWREDRRQLDSYVLPAWRNQRLMDISIDDVDALLAVIAKRGPIQANRTRSLLHKLFKFAVVKRAVTVNPVTGTERPGGSETDRRRQRVLTDDEIRQLFQQLEDQPPPMAAAFKLRLFTAQRGGEVAKMRWSDVDFDNEIWTIPAGDAKDKLAHRVPLSAPALTLLAALLADAREKAAFVLEGARGKRQKASAAAAFGIPDFRGHDLRRTAASRMASAGVQRLVIGKVLNHVDTGVTAIYDRHGYDAEKRVALDTLARHIDSVVNAKPASVLPFVAAGRG